MIRFTLLFLLASLAPSFATNIAPDGTAIIGVHNTINSTLGTPYHNTNVNPPTVLNNGNTVATVDTWANNTSNDHSYIGVIWPTTRTDQVNTITVDFATFLDGGWFGPNGQTPGPGNPLNTALHHTEPTVQITTDGGSVWNNITATSNYPSQMDGHEIGGGGNPNPTQFQATWTLTSPQSNINGIRLIGREGGNAGADSNGFISASEISIDASPAPVNPVLWADPVRVQAGQNSILHWDLPDGVSSAVLQTSTGSFLANVTTDTGSLAVQPSGMTTYHLNYGSTTALTTAFSGESLIITEFMANNDQTLEDEDGDNEDWIEIYNASTSTINTSAWSLCDDLLPGSEWALPARSLAPGEFLVVFASGKNRSPATGELHTDFKLSADGEDLVLRNPSNQITSSFPAFGTQYPDISQGIPMLGVTGTPANPAYFNPASPASENSAGSSPGPVIENVTKNIPSHPTNTPLLITAQVTSPTATLTTVSLHHRRMFAAEQSIVMVDNGTNGDTTANDGFYSATIPGSQFIAGEMVRWFVTAEENTGITSREPRFASPLNSPEYHGTVTSSPTITGQLPVVYWFTANPSAATSPSGTRSSLHFNGEFYDNIFSRRRGHFGSTLVPKKSIKFDFNPGYHFRILPGEPRVEEINLNTTDPDKSYIRQILSWDLYEMAGVPGSRSFMMRLEQNGSFWGVSTYVEQPDEDFLKREPLLDNEGALYKMFNEATNATSGAEKKTRRDENNADLHSLVTGISPSSPSRNTFLWDNVDIPAAINFMAASRVMHENDDQAKNYYLFRNTTTTGEWTFVPWDKDLTWGRNYTRQGSTFESLYNDTIWADNDTTSPFPGSANASPSHPLFGNSSHTKNDGPWCRLSDAIIDNPVTRRMYLRRLRTQMDELLQTSSTPLGSRVLENRIEELYAHMADQVALDRTIWAFPNPPYGAAQTFRQAIDIIKNDYLPRRRSHFFNTHTGTGSFKIPAFPQASNPTITFGNFDYNPASGNQDHEYLSLNNPNSDDVDVSGWFLEGGISHTLKPGTVIPANGALHLTPNAIAFRQREISPTGGQQHFVQGNYSGHLSNFGETVTLSDTNAQLVDTFTYNGTPSDNQLNLVISEMMYHPETPDAEFLELTNISETITLDLANVAFTSGLSFTFPPDFQLPPGARTLVVLNQSIFESVHGAGHPIAGIFSSGRLSNEGEQIKLEDADGSTIRQFTYDTTLPWSTPAAGGNYSLVLINPTTNPDHALPQNWRPSVSENGNPGTSSTVTAFTGDPDEDLDLDGLSALVEYALGTTDNTFDPSPLTFINGGISFSRKLAADDIRIIVETSTDLITWKANTTTLSEQVHNNNGTLTEHWIIPSGPRLFIRIQVNLIP